MTEFNPLSGAILQSPMVQQQQSAEKTSQIHREQILRKNTAAEDDELENQVENAEELQPARQASDEDQSYQQRRPQPSANPDDPEHLDITA